MIQSASSQSIPLPGVRLRRCAGSDVPMLGRMFEKRLKGYRAIGYEMESDHKTVVENVDTGSL